MIDDLNVSRETFDRLKTYEALLKKWNPAINLVAKSTLSQAWDRHFVDSLQVWRAAPESPEHWADLGSGGGFPGLVMAIVAAEKSPDTTFTLVESDQRKATFLRTVARDTGITVNVIADRIESVVPLGADVISARALASLDMLLGFADRHLAQGGIALFQKGARHDEEITEALANWRFDVQKFDSRTESGAVVLKIEGLARV